MKRKFERKKRLCRKRLRDSWRNRQKKCDVSIEKKRKKDRYLEIRTQNQREKEKE